MVKKVQWICELKNKLISFTYYLKLFFTLTYTIKLIKLLSNFKLLSWFTKCLGSITLVIIIMY